MTLSGAPTRPFRFGVQATRAKSATEWRELACRIEDLGYSTLSLADHYLGPGPAGRETGYPPQYLAPIAAMATAAAVTTTLRVGCRVFCMDYHVPGVLAKEAATLDLLSDGRLEFGIGAGWSAPEYRAMGLEFAPPGERISKLIEVIELVKAHWSGEPLDIEGKFVTATGYSGLPQPVQRPHPPIMIGGGRRRVLSLAGREADIVSMNTVPFDAVNADGLTPRQEAARRLDYVRRAAGDRFGLLDIESSPFFTEVTDDSAGALARLAEVLGTAPELLADHPNVLVGTADEIAERLYENRETLGANYISIQQKQIDAFAPVVVRLFGT
ncbi:TIGR03621 family F420-dependent LLM class oxidoreductase [Nocardia alni]|uniref:TIGR03621 family F420-dependent LLM class oxidoreductase n=1 Tax=Nocardia alni TaxID=2815723 RepID=UPI001C239C8C|nr:TIGR03621 family F420-dependent LLM class oxidoreductase [Nocardia alni]